MKFYIDTRFKTLYSRQIEREKRYWKFEKRLFLGLILTVIIVIAWHFLDQL